MIYIDEDEDNQVEENFEYVNSTSVRPMVADTKTPDSLMTAVILKLQFVNKEEKPKIFKDCNSQ
jgi:hypothetical protein